MIIGQQIELHPATAGDRQRIYRWFAQSNLTASMAGPPDFPDHPIPDFEEFAQDYADYFFDGSAPASGRSYLILLRNEKIGQINYQSCEKTARAAELDIWLADRKYTGQGYGTDAIRTLSDFLLKSDWFDLLLIAPSARNLRAIAAYQKAGFRITDRYSSDQPDYDDAVTLCRKKVCEI